MKSCRGYGRQKLRQGRSDAEDVSIDVSEIPVIVYVAMREEGVEDIPFLGNGLQAPLD